MKKYNLIFEDNLGNDLKVIRVEFKNKKEALNYAKNLQATTQINDLKKIIVKLNN